MAAITAAALTAGATIYAANEARKGGKEAAAAIESGKVDPNEVSRLTREEGRRNLLESLDVEAEVVPENQALRRGATKALLPLVGDTGTTEQIAAIDRQIGEGGTADESQLLTESIAEARRQLQLGGSLDSVTRNEISRRAIAAGGNTGAARFLVPRDLGISSLQLATDRLERGGRFGQIDQGRNQQAFENLARLRQLRTQLGQSRQNQAIQLAGFGQSLAPPDVGLAPGEFAGLFVQNQNLAAEAAGQRARNRATNAENFGKAINAGVGALPPIFNSDE
jgi:hypothetical protein